MIGLKQLFDELLGNLFTIILVEKDVSLRFDSHLRVCAKYLMACNALKHGRDSITCEDVVVGYTLTLKLLTEDIRDYVIKYYDKDTNLKISDFEAAENNNVQNDGLGFKIVISIIFAILAFFEVLLIIIYIKEMILPGLPFTNNPIIRFPVLIISVYFAKKFYNYLTEGGDKNLFEDGKSKVMLILLLFS